MPPPSASEPERFCRDLTAALGRAVAPGDRLALAVSGGPDSMGMAWLAARAWPGQVIAATVDHGLRPESADEASMVARWCEGAGVPHATLAADVPKGPTGNLHGWAREQRYLLLKRWAVERSAAVLCTAHHADDQAETFLMRAARATGLSGLSGIRSRLEESIPIASSGFERDGEGWSVTVRYGELATVRPLLRWRRAALRALCERERVPFVDDPSNVDPRFDRTRYRAWLASAPWLDVERLARTAENLGAIDADNDAISRWLWERCRVDCDPHEARLDMTGLPRDVRRRLVRLALEHVTNAALDGGGSRHAFANVETLLDQLDTRGQGMKGDVLVSAAAGVWHFRAAPPRRPT